MSEVRKRLTQIDGSWTKVSRGFCAAQADNLSNRRWQRLGFYCYAHMDASGVCLVKPGGLERFFKAEVTNLYRVLDKAVEEGWLDGSSKLTRLVAPKGAVEFMTFGLLP